MSVRAIVSICCSPPDIRPPCRSRMTPRLGKSANSRSGVHVGASGARRLAPDFQVLRHGEVGEDAPVLRDVPEPRPGDRVGLEPVDPPAVERDRRRSPAAPGR